MPRQLIVSNASEKNLRDNSGDDPTGNVNDSISGVHTDMNSGNLKMGMHANIELDTQINSTAIIDDYTIPLTE
jgi:hypothetical protein